MNATSSAKTLCLVMIVKNESKVIKRCLESVKDHIDYWIVCDTGSKDHTRKVIRNYFKKRKIPGEFFEHKWKDFGHNRSLAVQAAKGKADYLLLMDADFTLEVKDPDFKENLGEFDGYMIKYEGNNEYRQMLLVRGDLDWKYVGVTHEYIHSTEKKNEANFDGFTITHHKDGGCRADKFHRDVQLLRKGLESEPNNGRYWFYLGQSYYNLEQWEKAIEAYQKRIDVGGWDQEIYYSMYQIGCAKMKMGKNVWEFMGDFLKAHEYRPQRLEGIYEVVKHCREQKMYKVGYEIGKIVLDKVQSEKGPLERNIKTLTLAQTPSDRLFIQRDIHDWMIWDELSICAFYSGELEEASDLWLKVIKEKKFDPKKLNHLKTNYGFALKASIKHKRLQSQEQKVIVSLTTIPSRLKLLANTLISLKRQTYPRVQINLCLPRWSKKENCEYQVPPEILNDKTINVVWAQTDYGPSTKLLGTLESLDETKDGEAMIMVADDDVVYGPGVVQRLVEASKKYPNCAIGYCGWNAQRMIEEGKFDLLYEEDRELEDASPVNILEGYRGVLYKRKFFDWGIFDYPSYTKDLRWVDDVWISGHLARKRIPKIVVKYREGQNLSWEETWTKLWRNNYVGHKKNNNSLSMMPGFKRYNHAGAVDFETKFPGIWKEDLQRTCKAFDLSVPVPIKKNRKSNVAGDSNVTESQERDISNKSINKDSEEIGENLEENEEEEFAPIKKLLDNEDRDSIKRIEGNGTLTELLESDALGDKIDFGLLVPTYKRIDYLDITLNYLSESDLSRTLIVFIDDFSEDLRIPFSLRNFSEAMDDKDVPVLSIYKTENCNMYHSLRIGWDILDRLGVDYLCNLDSDVIVKPGWLTTLRETYDRFLEDSKDLVKKSNDKDSTSFRFTPENLIVTGFNANNRSHHAVLGQGEYYYLKISIGGVNFFFKRELYSKIRGLLTDIRWDYRIVSYLHDQKVVFVCTKPSIIQHIGLNGLNSNQGKLGFDIALDFYLDEDKDFIYFPGLDSAGGDYEKVSGKSVEEMKKIVLQNPELVAFNTSGWTKRTIKANLKEWDVHDVTRFKGTYVKREKWELGMSSKASGMSSIASRKVVGTFNAEYERKLFELRKKVEKSVEEEEENEDVEGNMEGGVKTISHVIVEKSHDEESKTIGHWILKYKKEDQKMSQEEIIGNIRDSLVVLKKYLEKHDIEYWIDAGTLLGSYRDKHIIPWDDDADIGLTKENLFKLMGVVADDPFESDSHVIIFRRGLHSDIISFKFVDTNTGLFVDGGIYHLINDKYYFFWPAETFIYDRATIFPLKTGDLEGEIYPVPNDSKEYLTIRYKDLTPRRYT